MPPRFVARMSKHCEIFERKFTDELGNLKLSLIDRVYLEDDFASSRVFIISANYRGVPLTRTMEVV